MLKYLLIAEKPSLMRDIRACYNKHKSEICKAVGEIEFIALSGHVCCNCQPDEYPQWEGKSWGEIDYPMEPSTWKIRPIKDARKMQTLKDVYEKQKHCDGIIVATDSDVEGYGIYHLLETYLKIEDKPALRFIEHSLTDKEIFEQLLCMTDYHKDSVHTAAKDSFLIRSRADWLYGMNATRIMSNKSGQTMRVGRVKAPTIKLIYDNSESISNFKQEKYYVITADYGDFSSVLSNDDGSATRFKDPSKAGTFPNEGIVEKAETKRVYTHAPKLFDLTTIQAEAGRAFGYTPAHTLDVIQSLYEKHKVISYPRTQCRYVSSEKAKEFSMMLSHMSAFPDLGKIAASISSADIAKVAKDKMVVNDAEVQKESHDALLPTSQKANPSAMTQDEKNICHMIYARLLSQFMPKLAEDKTNLVIRHGDSRFLAQGKSVAEQGWRVLFKEMKDKYLPALKEGQKITAKKIGPVEKVTTPPKRLTQATLINAMQNIANLIEDPALRRSLADSKGIGTSSTRANIIEEILQSGYAEDKKGGLFITDLGKTYVESLKGIDIISPEFAAVIDTDIKRVQRGEADYEAVYKKVEDGLRNMCREMEKLPQKPRQYTGGGGETMKEACPVCGTKLVSMKYSYMCPKDGCEFKINKSICGKEITEKILKTLLAGKTTPAYKLKKKDGTTFTAKLVLSGKELKFDFSSDIVCPACRDKDVTINRGGAFCECGFKLFRKEFGAVLNDTQLKLLLTKRETDEISDFVSKKSGNNYTAKLVLDEENSVRLKFTDTKADNSDVSWA